MGSGYERKPEPLVRPRTRRLPIAIGIVVVLLALMVAKPWASSDTVPTGADVTHSSGKQVTSPRPIASIPAGSAVHVDADPAWPATVVASGPATPSVSQAERALTMLTGRAGTWGIGVTGVGPRLIREEPWSDWTAVEPEPVGGPPAHIAIWPGTGLCTGLPTIYDGPTIVAITMPVGLGSRPTLAGWWTDGGRAASIDDSVRLLTSVDDAGMATVERVDRAKWPVGRYEFHVQTKGGIVALTVCLTRRV